MENVCLECNKETNNPKFCNSSCSAKYNNKHRSISFDPKNDKRTKIVECCICNIEIEVNIRSPKNYCKCDKCKAKKFTKIYLNKGKPKPICPVCDTTLEKFGSICCSNECASIHRKNVQHEQIRASNGTCHGIRVLKQFLIDTTGHKCCICNGEEWNEMPMPLVIDHINGRAKDNRLENLRLVCGNCDMQLPTYKSKNKNSDRKRK